MGQGTSKATEVPQFTLEMTLTVQVPIEEVITMAVAAGKAILDIYDSEASKWEVELKSDSSPLTRADRDANTIICDALQLLSPHIPIVSEENTVAIYALRKTYQYYWLVDPLDGTKEFLKRNGEFTVNIALMQGDTPVMGVVHVPVSGKTYWAVQGKGAWLRTTKPTPTQRRIECAEFGLEDPKLKIVASSSHLNKETEEFIALFSEPQLTQYGSSLKLLMVAEGTAHIYPRLAPTCEWDTAAADIIVREAGGAVLQAGVCDSKGNALTDWKEALLKETPMVYNKAEMLNPFFIVFGKRRLLAASQEGSVNGMLGAAK
ncbi:MAG: hypothetical protein WDW36_004547 [Sanguina aurantia]